MQQKLHRLSVRITSRLQAMTDLGQLPPQLVRTKELLQLTEFEEQVQRASRFFFCSIGLAFTDFVLQTASIFCSLIFIDFVSKHH
jgi:hypothetical protein